MKGKRKGRIGKTKNERNKERKINNGRKKIGDNEWLGSSKGKMGKINKM